MLHRIGEKLGYSLATPRIAEVSQSELLYGTARRSLATPRLAWVSQNDIPRPAAIARALALGAEIVQSVSDREAIVKSDGAIDADFAMPAANWETSENDYLQAYRLMASLDWSEIRLLRLRSQCFTGNSLITMGTALGLRSIDPIPDDFETKWSDQTRQGISSRWARYIYGLPGNLVLRTPNILGEAGWWIDDVLVNLDAVDYQERINLLNLAGLVDRFCGKDARVLEIGGGYGALSRALVSILRPSQYVICDLPESLLFSGLYLSLAQGSSTRIASLSEGLTPGKPGEICLMPNYLAQKLLLGQHFDLVINTLSMSEMSAHQVATYGALISKAIGSTGVFFEQNHDNSHLGLLDCREHLAPSFRRKVAVDAAELPTSRGTAMMWSN